MVNNLLIIINIIGFAGIFAGLFAAIQYIRATKIMAGELKKAMGYIGYGLLLLIFSLLIIPGNMVFGIDIAGYLSLGLVIIFLTGVFLLAVGSTKLLSVLRGIKGGSN